VLDLAGDGRHLRTTTMIETAAAPNPDHNNDLQWLPLHRRAEIVELADEALDQHLMAAHVRDDLAVSIAAHAEALLCEWAGVHADAPYERATVPGFETLPRATAFRKDGEPTHWVATGAMTLDHCVSAVATRSRQIAFDMAIRAEYLRALALLVEAGEGATLAEVVLAGRSGTGES
jgi:hypothetical protein